jgi:hypothetical protein
MGNYYSESVNPVNVLYFEDKNSEFILEDIFELNEGKNKLINVKKIDSENCDNKQIEEYLKSQNIFIATSSNINNLFHNYNIKSLENDSIPFFIFINSREEKNEDKNEDKNEEEDDKEEAINQPPKINVDNRKSNIKDNSKPGVGKKPQPVTLKTPVQSNKPGSRGTARNKNQGNTLQKPISTGRPRPQIQFPIVKK